MVPPKPKSFTVSSQTGYITVKSLLYDDMLMLKNHSVKLAHWMVVRKIVFHRSCMSIKTFRSVMLASNANALWTIC